MLRVLVSCPSPASYRPSECEAAKQPAVSCRASEFLQPVDESRSACEAANLQPAAESRSACEAAKQPESRSVSEFQPTAESRSACETAKQPADSRSASELFLQPTAEREGLIVWPGDHSVDKDLSSHEASYCPSSCEAANQPAVSIRASVFSTRPAAESRSTREAAEQPAESRSVGEFLLPATENRHA